MEYTYFNRDISWLSFNERVLKEAERSSLPLMERINFLSIYSSNLDEFFRVRIPTLIALDKVVDDSQGLENPLGHILRLINLQQTRFGNVLKDDIIPTLKEQYQIELVYNSATPKFLRESLANYFLSKAASFIQVVHLDDKKKFAPKNNALYVFVLSRTSDGKLQKSIINVPSEQLPRFNLFHHRNRSYILFLDDIIKLGLPFLFKKNQIVSSHNIKVTRSDEFDFEEQSDGDLASKMTRELEKREKGLATRFLYSGTLPSETLKEIRKILGLRKASLVRGGPYHNLKDLSSLPINFPECFNALWPTTTKFTSASSLFDVIRKKPFFIHTPYHSFDPLIRFFNESSIDPAVTHIYTTIYRIAKNSLIANALINAARHGKKVQVFVELKARFDENNNFRWAKKMEAAGVKITYSLPEIKVHSKIALVKRKYADRAELFGVMGTGNFHENNASLYADHYLFTNDHDTLSELEELFQFFKIKRKGLDVQSIRFEKLLVGLFNLHETFLHLIEGEIDNARVGLPAAITIKVNAIEERTLIDKLYAASQAGVKIRLIVRGICCLVPGVKGMSENITVLRIVDRYLEHGRVFVFENNTDPIILVGSSDWMSRSMRRRIEVCFKVTDANLKKEIIELLEIQLSDTKQAMILDSSGNAHKIKRPQGPSVQSQRAISYWLAQQK